MTSLILLLLRKLDLWLGAKLAKFLKVPGFDGEMGLSGELQVVHIRNGKVR